MFGLHLWLLIVPGKLFIPFDGLYLFIWLDIIQDSSSIHPFPNWCILHISVFQAAWHTLIDDRIRRVLLLHVGAYISRLVFGSALNSGQQFATVIITVTASNGIYIVFCMLAQLTVRVVTYRL